ncbi:MAG: murein biosynthesis integral membrane protein MurJ [Acidobacteriota bacterium]
MKPGTCRSFPGASPRQFATHPPISGGALPLRTSEPKVSGSASSGRLARSAGAMGAMTLLSRVFGYLRDLLQATLLGAADSADAFVIAFRIPNLLRRLVGEGALTAAFIPVFTEVRKQEGHQAGWRFASTTFWTLASLLLVLVGVGILLAPELVRFLALGFEGVAGKLDLTVQLARIMFPYLFFIGLAALAMAILNSLGLFAAPAFTPVLLNLSIIAAALLFARHSQHPAFWFAIGVVVGGGLQLVFQIPFLVRRNMPLAPSFHLLDPRLRKVGRLMLPGLLGVGVTQINLVVDSQVASFLGSGSVSYLYYAIRVEELVLGVFVISISTVILPSLSHFAAAGRPDLMQEALGRGMGYVVFVTIPAMFALWVLRVPIISTLFQHGNFTPADTQFTATALAFYGLGLLPTGLVKVLAPACYARFDTATPVKIGAAAFALHIPMCIGLAIVLGHAGIALSTSLAALANAGGLIWIVARREGKGWLEPLASALARTLLAALIMAGGLLAMVHWIGFDPGAGILVRAGHLAVFIGSGGLAYLAASWILGSAEGRQIWREITRARDRGDPARP